MRVKPIIFSGPMVRAILEGKKTQTRRVTKQPPPECSINFMIGEEAYLPPEQRTPVRRHFEAWGGPLFETKPKKFICGVFQIVPRIQPRDILWVRETFGMWPAENSDRLEDAVIYRADDDDWECRMFDWRPSIHMPRWASRLTLEVTEVRVQRLQDISEEDVWAEGVEPVGNGAAFVQLRDALTYSTPRTCFGMLWDSINEKRGFGWDANPWVCAVTFQPHQINVDEFLAQRRAA